jgi:2-octaprenyl-6-methoxyphenol hydroxylase
MSGKTAEAIIVGGGLAGRIAALAVARAGLETIHLAPPAPPDRRTSALMQPSVAYLQELGIVADPPDFGEPLRKIRIIDATPRLIRAPETLFDSAEAGLDAFGWNFANIALAERCEAIAATLPGLRTLPRFAHAIEIDAEGGRVTLDSGETITVPLIVGADGKASPVRAAAGIAVRQHPFAEAALVADLELERPLDGVSVEFHYPHGPFTLVPAGGPRANLVWIDERPTLEAMRMAEPAAFAAALADKAQRLFGAIRPASKAFVFPLSALSVAHAGAAGAVLVGEAAHAFPPIGAQGLNLALRDIADLAAALAESDRAAPDWAVVLSVDYARRRAADLLRTGGMVDALFRSLLAEMIPAQALRAGGLWALKLVPPLRRQAFSLGMGGR